MVQMTPLQMPAIGQPVPAARHGLLSPLNPKHSESMQNSPRMDDTSRASAKVASMKNFLTDKSPRLVRDNHSRRNDVLSKSVAVSSTRSVAMEVIGNATTQSQSRNMRGGSAIEIRDIIESSQKCSHKIGTAYVPQFQKPMSYTF